MFSTFFSFFFSLWRRIQSSHDSTCCCCCGIRMGKWRRRRRERQLFLFFTSSSSSSYLLLLWAWRNATGAAAAAETTKHQLLKEISWAAICFYKYKLWQVDCERVSWHPSAHQQRPEKQNGKTQRERERKVCYAAITFLLLLLWTTTTTAIQGVLKLCTRAALLWFAQLSSG